MGRLSRAWKPKWRRPPARTYCSPAPSASPSAAILIPGKARRAGAELYVPALVEELRHGGLDEHQITLFLADGTHEQHLADDLAALVGRSIASRVRWLGHDCQDGSQLVELGVTRRGTPVFLNRQVLEAEVKVLTGRIVPHYFAGFSGGRKALIPGVAGWRTICANHRLTLAAERGLHPAVRPGVLAENPVHLDMMDGARMARPDFCLNTVLAEDHQWAGAVAGDWEAAHAEGCRQAGELLHLRLAEPADALITSAGGLPHDMNFMQALKAVFNLREVVRPGGAILWIAECAGGLHPGFLKWSAITADPELEAAVRRDYDLRGHNSIMLRQLVRHANVALCSALPPEQVARLGLHPVASPEEGVRWLRERVPSTFHCLVARSANVLCATLASPAPARLTENRPNSEAQNAQ